MRSPPSRLPRAPATAAFAVAAGGYWTTVFPRVCGELGRWRAQALEIPDPRLRADAVRALAKRGNMEGAAAFATFAPARRRAAVVRATVAFQSAYNYLDTLSEQPNARPTQNGARLHEALLAALEASSTVAPRDMPARASPTIEGFERGEPRDYYEHHDAGRGDGGYLASLIEACRDSLAELPSYRTVAPAAWRAAERVVGFQALAAGGAAGEGEAIERFGRNHTPAGVDLRWWETAASCGSSLGVHAMLAAAAAERVQAADVQALERAYFPWIGALHSMLDHLIDTSEDARMGQRNLIDCYGSPGHAAERMSVLAEHALACARALRPAHRHELIVAAMASFYLADPQAHTSDAAPVARPVLDVFGPLARPALAVFKTRRAAERVYYACRLHGHHDKAAEPLALLPSRR